MAVKRGRPRGVLLDDEAIRRQREQLGWTQIHLAEAAILGLRTIQAAERGVAVSLESALSICATLGLPYVEVYRRRPEEIQQALSLRGLAPLPPPTPWIVRRGVAGLRLSAGRQVLLAPPGSGATSLGRWLVSENQSAYQGVAWLEAGLLTDQEQLMWMQRALAEAFGFAEQLPRPGPISASAWTQAFQHRLWAQPRLLVFDGVKDSAVVRAFQSDSERGAVLAITADRLVASQLSEATMTVPLWSRSEVKGWLSAQCASAPAPRELEALLDAIGEDMTRAAEVSRLLDSGASPDETLAVLSEPEQERSLSSRAWRLLAGMREVGAAWFPPAWVSALMGERSEDAVAELASADLIEWLSPQRLRLTDDGHSFVDSATRPLALSGAAHQMAVALSQQTLSDAHRSAAADVVIWREVLAALPEERGALLLALEPLLRFKAQPELMPWIAQACQSAPAEQAARLSALMGWQHMLVEDASSHASRWLQQSAEQCWQTGQIDRGVVAGLWVTLFERRTLSVEQLCQRRASLHALAGQHPQARCLALAGLGMAMAETRPREAAERLTEAAALCVHLAPRSVPLASSALAVGRALLGETLPLDGALNILAEHLRHDALSSYMLAALGHQLGVELPQAAPAQVLLGTPVTQTHYRLNQLLEIATNLQLPDSSGTSTVTIDGQGFSVAACIDSTPFSQSPGVFFELLLPLSAASALLEGEGLEYALRFVSASGGREHPAYQALASLRE